MPKFFNGFSFVLLSILVVLGSVPLQVSARSLGIGSRGAEVLQLQERLQQSGYFPKNLKPTSYFGLITRKAVLAFQKAKHLPVVGLAGPLTMAALVTFYEPIVSNPIVSQSIPLRIVSVPATVAVSQLPSIASPHSVIPSAELEGSPVTAPSTAPQIAITDKIKTALPLYIYPSVDEKNWQTAIDASSHVNFIIANVDSGPGTEVKNNWTAMIEKTVAAGGKVYGYVHTNYGKRDGKIVDKEISLWLKFYPKISGVFFDEAAADVSKVPYYKARYNYVKNINQKLRVVINPGTNTDEAYMGVSDINVIFESGYKSWLTKKMPSWVNKYPKERFYAIVYDVPTETDMKGVVATAKTRNFGNMFVTSASGPSSALPAYFNVELAEISK